MRSAFPLYQNLTRTKQETQITDQSLYDLDEKNPRQNITKPNLAMYKKGYISI